MVAVALGFGAGSIAAVPTEEMKCADPRACWYDCDFGCASAGCLTEICGRLSQGLRCNYCI